LKILPCAHIQFPWPYRLCKADHIYLVTWTAVRLTAAKLKPLIFYMSCCEHIHSHDFIRLLLVACTILLYNRIHAEGWDPRANRGPVCTLENFQWFGEPCFVGAVIWQASAANSQAGQAWVITDLISALCRISLMLALKRSEVYVDI
jgi:hypothetical protein